MIVFLSKLLAPALSPVVIVCGLMVAAILLWSRRPRIARFGVIAALVLLILASNRWISQQLARYLETRIIPVRPLPQAGAIVVLSSDLEPAQAGETSSLMDGPSANRLLYGAELYREGKAPTIIVSGGRQPWFKSVEPMSQEMAEVLEVMGVPKSAILQENQSANTYENALDVKAVMAAHGIGRILLVTSAMHMPRALGLFKRQGIDAIAAPCDFIYLTGKIRPASVESVVLDLIPSADNLATSSGALRELLGAAVYHAAGKL